MNKIIKMLLLGALITQGALAMQEDVFTVQNKTGKTIQLSWMTRAPKGYKGPKKSMGPIKLENERSQSMVPVDQMVEIRFAEITPGASWVKWDANEILARRSGNALDIKLQDLPLPQQIVSSKPTEPEKAKPVPQGGFDFGTQEGPVIIAALNWFPVLKWRLEGKIGKNQLATWDEATLEQYIRSNAKTMPIAVKDFFPDLLPGYTSQQFEFQIEKLQNAIRERREALMLSPAAHQEVLMLISLARELDKESRR